MPLIFYSLTLRSMRLRIRAQHSEIQNPVSNMADQKAKSYLIEMDFGTRQFLRSLISNASSTFKNSKFRNQYHVPIAKTCLIGVKFASREFLGSRNF